MTSDSDDPTRVETIDGSPTPRRRGPGALVPERVSRAFAEFTQAEASSAIVLLAAAIAALLWANSPWNETYDDVWHTVVAVDIGRFDASESLQHWVNDGLMALFFLLVGLEIKRELVIGELADRRRALLPVSAALGGMAVPALLYLALNAGGDGADGWGIPMATDIAFAVGVLTLLGSRVPLSLRVFLLSLAIVDDIGATAVIALLDAGEIETGALSAALVILGGILFLQRLGAHSLPLHLVAGLLLWATVFESGIHPTLAGVALGLLTPVAAGANGEGSMLERLEHLLSLPVSFVVVPLFALANAGVDVGGGAIGDAVESDVARGVVLGLLIGKPAGILLFAWLAVRAGVASLPEGVRWAQVAAVAVLGGVGFTVSLFMTELVFADEGALIDEAKIAILAASVVAGAVGYFALRLSTPAR
jgi:NhaA family Na+:H+ antiporter